MRRLAVAALASASVFALAACVVQAQSQDRGDGEPQDRPARSDRPGHDDRNEGRAAQKAPTKSGVVTEFTKNPNGETDGLRLDDGTEVRFRPNAAEKVTAAIALKDRITIEGWTHSGESVIHAATIKSEASGKLIVVDRPPPEISQRR